MTSPLQGLKGCDASLISKRARFLFPPVFTIDGDHISLKSGEMKGRFSGSLGGEQ